MTTFEVEKGVNYLADLIEYKERMKDVLSLILSAFGGTPAWIATSFAFHRLETNAELTRNYEELLGIEMKRMSHFFKPEFLRGYSFTFGGAKRGGLSYFDQMGSITNFSGTLYDIFSYSFEIAPEIVRDTLKQYIPMPKEKRIPEYIKKVAKDHTMKMLEGIVKSTFGHFVKDFQTQYTKLELITVHKASGLLNLTKSQDEIKGRRGKKELGSGGWVVHPGMRERLQDSPITFMITHDDEIEMEGRTIKLREKKPLTEDEVEAIAESGKSLPWGIAKVKEDGEFYEWLVEPEPYENPVTYKARNGERIPEARPAFKNAGILWIFDFHEGMFVGGDKAPGSSVAAPLNPLFTDLLLQEENNVKKFRDAVGGEPKRFVAALEVQFKDRDKSEITWREGYDYPIFFPPKYQERFQKYFIGVHRLDLVKSIIVKRVLAL